MGQSLCRETSASQTAGIQFPSLVISRLALAKVVKKLYDYTYMAREIEV